MIKLIFSVLFLVITEFSFCKEIVFMPIVPAGENMPEIVDKYCKEVKETWGATDIICEWIGGAGPLRVKHGVPLLKYGYESYKYDGLAEYCKSAKKYGLKVWVWMDFSDRGLWRLMKRGESKEEGIKRMIEVIKDHQKFYARDKKGKVYPCLEAGRYPAGVGTWSFTSPEVIQFCKNQVKDIAFCYKKKYGVVEGIFWDEETLDEAMDEHGDDVELFSEFCRKEFGEAYPGKDMPSVDPNDKWWRRYYLFRIHLVNNLIREVNKYAKSLGLKSIMRVDPLEAYASRNWKIGVDINHLSKLNDYILTMAGDLNTRESHLNFKNILFGVGPSYKTWKSLTFAAAFHGKDIWVYNFFAPHYKRYIGRLFTKSEWDIFLGDKLPAWLHLIHYWNKGKSPAKVAVATNMVYFVMQHPGENTSVKEKVDPVITSLSRFMDIDVFEMFQVDNLSRYKLVVVPADTPVGLKEEIFKKYINYVKEGGNILCFDTKWIVSRRDLTGRKDVTSKITGVKVKEYGRKSSAVIPLSKEVPEIKSEVPLRSSLIEIVNKNVCVLARDEYGEPRIVEYTIGKGKVISCWGRYPERIALGEDKFISLIGTLSKKLYQPPIQAEGNLQIRQSVMKDNKLAITVRDNRGNVKKIINAYRSMGLDMKKISDMEGRTKIKVDIRKVGIKGEKFSVKDIITGKRILSPSGKDYWTEEQLKGGIPVKLKHLGEFKVITIGEYGSLKDFGGVIEKWIDVKSLKDQEGEIPLEAIKKEKVSKIPSKEGIKVGIFKPVPEIGRCFGADGLYELLKENFSPVLVKKYDYSTLKNLDVFLLTQVNFRKEGWIKRFITEWNKDLRRWVEEGGGVMAFHDAVGYRNYKSIFPEICKKGIGHTYCIQNKENIESRTCEVVKMHPVTEGLKISQKFVHSYADHIQLEKGDKGEVLIREVYKLKAPVVIAGKVGKGKYIANGMININLKEQEITPEGVEAKIIINGIKWLADKQKGVS